ncbi:hypothetical protein CCACVL1_27052 [Corchorus capsularis]|uniref:Uncharacterized protein n=1 Tax=Corchorus capsularis TaxID=210143 RepID=A0A1R3GCC5_COCAP|nr:hypothetical protein CCACVL1_27052 [Corchorus capsularis]
MASLLHLCKAFTMQMRLHSVVHGFI